MSEERKISDAEKEEVQQIRKTVYDLIVFVGQLELQKSLIEADIRVAKEQFGDLTKQEQSLIKLLGEKYGSGEIDLETGIIT
jgi:hypothetical protein